MFHPQRIRYYDDDEFFDEGNQQREYCLKCHSYKYFFFVYVYIFFFSGEHPELYMTSYISLEIKRVYSDREGHKYTNCLAIVQIYKQYSHIHIVDWLQWQANIAYYS